MSTSGLFRAGGLVVALMLGEGIVRAALGPSARATKSVEDSRPPISASAGGVTSELEIAGAALATRDAPGTDSSWAEMRPAQSTRLLDAPLTRAGTRIRIYAATGELAVVMDEVERKLRSSGFARRESNADSRTRAYQRGSRHVLARYSLSSRQERVLVSLVEIENRAAED